MNANQKAEAQRLSDEDIFWTDAELIHLGHLIASDLEEARRFLDIPAMNVEPSEWNRGRNCGIAEILDALQADPSRFGMQPIPKTPEPELSEAAKAGISPQSSWPFKLQTEKKSYHELLQEAQSIVESSPLWKRFIDCTPLSNDIAVWMVEFARRAAEPEKAEEPEQAPDPDWTAKWLEARRTRKGGTP